MNKPTNFTDACVGNQHAVDVLKEAILSATPPMLYFGAGLSYPYGYPTWKDFLQKANNDSSRMTTVDRTKVVELLSNTPPDFVGAATYISDKNLKGFRTFLRNTFAKAPNERSLTDKPTTLELLAELPFAIAVTTNYDLAAEKVFADSRKPFFRVLTGEQINEEVSEWLIQHLANPQHACRYPILIKLHGEVLDERGCVITNDDYDRVYNNNQSWLMRFLVAQMTSRPVLFVGAGLEEDRLLKDFSALIKTSTHMPRVAILESKDNDPARRQDVWDRLGSASYIYPLGQHEYINSILRIHGGRNTQVRGHSTCGCVRAAFDLVSDAVSHQGAMRLSCRPDYYVKYASAASRLASTCLIWTVNYTKPLDRWKEVQGHDKFFTGLRGATRFRVVRFPSIKAEVEFRKVAGAFMDAHQGSRNMALLGVIDSSFQTDGVQDVGIVKCLSHRDQHGLLFGSWFTREDLTNKDKVVEKPMISGCWAGDEGAVVVKDVDKDLVAALSALRYIVENQGRSHNGTLDAFGVAQEWAKQNPSTWKVITGVK